MTEKQDRVVSFIVVFVGLLIVYTILSAECATGGNCRFASGTWFDWIATTLTSG